MTSVDDLDDGLVYDFDDQISEHEVEATEEVETLEPVAKRPIENDDGSDSEKPMSKRQKKLKKKSKLIEKKKEQIQYEINKKKDLPKSDPTTISEYFTTIIREKNPDLSALELEELYLKKSDFISTSKFTEERSVENLSSFLTQFSKAPKAIIFSMSNMRVADVSRNVGGGKKAIKLFAKNKLKEDLETVERVFTSNSKKDKEVKYFIATANRMEKILESSEHFFQGKDKLDIILDASYLDAKDNSLIASENTVLLCKVLRIILNKKSSVKILLY